MMACGKAVQKDLARRDSFPSRPHLDRLDPFVVSVAEYDRNPIEKQGGGAARTPIGCSFWVYVLLGLCRDGGRAKLKEL